MYEQCQRSPMMSRLESVECEKIYTTYINKVQFPKKYGHILILPILFKTFQGRRFFQSLVITNNQCICNLFFDDIGSNSKRTCHMRQFMYLVIEKSLFNFFSDQTFTLSPRCSWNVYNSSIISVLNNNFTHTFNVCRQVPLKFDGKYLKKVLFKKPLHLHASLSNLKNSFNVVEK